MISHQNSEQESGLRSVTIQIEYTKQVSKSNSTSRC